MPFPTKPTDKPLWTDATSANRTQPSTGRKNSGWYPGETPAAQEFNWLMYNIGSVWRGYFEDAIDQIKGLTGLYDAFVGPTNPLANYADLATAIAAMGAGARVLVLENLTLNSTVQITQLNLQLELKPGVTISKGSASTGIQVSAAGVRIKGGRFAGFSGGSDQAILVDSGASYCMIGETRFANNTSDITDANGNVTSYALINE